MSHECCHHGHEHAPKGKKSRRSTAWVICEQIICIIICSGLPILGFLGIAIPQLSWVHSHFHNAEPLLYAIGFLLLLSETRHHHHRSRLMYVLWFIWLAGLTYMLYHHGWLGWLPFIG